MTDQPIQRYSLAKDEHGVPTEWPTSNGDVYLCADVDPILAARDKALEIAKAALEKIDQMTHEEATHRKVWDALGALNDAMEKP